MTTELCGIPDAWFHEPIPAFSIPVLLPNREQHVAMILCMLDHSNPCQARLYLASVPPSRTAKLLCRVTSITGALFKDRITQEFLPLILLACDRIGVRFDSSRQPQMYGFKREEFDLVDAPLNSAPHLVAIPYPSLKN